MSLGSSSSRRVGFLAVSHCILQLCAGGIQVSLHLLCVHGLLGHGHQNVIHAQGVSRHCSVPLLVRQVSIDDHGSPFILGFLACLIQSANVQQIVNNAPPVGLGRIREPNNI